MITKCQSAGPHNIGKYDCSCPVISSNAVQCRTRLSQRPCRNPQCVREECSGARLSASVLATIPDTENDVTGSQSDERTTGESEPQGTPVRLSREELWSMQRALVGRIKLYPFETALETALNKVSEALKTR